MTFSQQAHIPLVCRLSDSCLQGSIQEELTRTEGLGICNRLQESWNLDVGQFMLGFLLSLVRDLWAVMYQLFKTILVVGSFKL